MRRPTWIRNVSSGSTGTRNSPSRAPAWLLRTPRLDLREEDRDLIGRYISSALGGAAFAEEQMKVFASDGIRRVKPALALSVFAGAAACNIAIEYDLRGPTSANSDSCASGTIAIGEAFHLIREGYADLILAGGVEAPCRRSYLARSRSSTRCPPAMTTRRPRAGRSIAGGTGS